VAQQEEAELLHVLEAHRRRHVLAHLHRAAARLVLDLLQQLVGGPLV